MARINLLPWRDQYREEKKKEFLGVLAGVAIFAGLASYLWVASIEGAIDNQRARNQILEKEIAFLQKQVEEIEKLKERRTELLDRMRVIQELQGTRPLIVRYFDEFVRAMPDGVYLTVLNRTGNTMKMEGVAESNNRVSSFMRNLDQSNWFIAPNLTSVSAAPDEGEQSSSFEMTVQTTVPKENKEEGS